LADRDEVIARLLRLADEGQANGHARRMGHAPARRRIVNRAGLTQQALARKMGATQPVVARLERGRVRPSMRTLERQAEATGSRLLIRFEPREGKRPQA
jgi:hypothetical protein